jgi:hypothetical protein
MTPGGTPKQAAKRLIVGTPLEGPARRLVGDWQVAREPKRTMDAILRYTNPVPRYGEGKPSHPGLTRIIDAGRDRYAALLGRFGEFTDDLGRIPVEPSADPGEPHWDNGWLPSLDAIALYCTLALNDPAVYLEVGSGNSTRFARRAITDHGLRTKIISIDPAPRASCNRLCDEVIRARLETLDISTALDKLGPGDVVFLDGSHRSFMNSDATVFFLEMMPHLPADSLVHIHDIYLPDDYPQTWRHRYYTEQYLLASWLLGGSAGYEVHCPNHFISRDPELAALVPVPSADPRIAAGEPTGPTSFWLRRSEDRPR